MQTEAEAFLQRIRAYPDDDAPRLVFADWLDEQGDPRGAFIRVQLALAHLKAEEAAAEGGRLGRVEREETRARLLTLERKLLAEHRKEWEVPLEGLATGSKFSRGFIEEVNVDARDFVRRAHELFAATPLRHVHLLNVGGSLSAALQCPLLSRLAALSIHASYAGEPLARAVARSEHLSGLRKLTLSRNRFDDAAAEHLANSPTLAKLEVLDLWGNELGETGARALAASPYLGSLRELELRENRVGPAGAEVLAGSERLAALERLGLADNEIGAARLQSLSRAHDLLRVPDLDLSDNGITAAGLQVILTLPPGPVEPDAVRIRELNLYHNPIGDAGARILAQCPSFGGLQTLRLADCSIGNDGARALGQSTQLPRLATLDLNYNPIGDPGFRAFIPPRPRNLRELIHPLIGLSRSVLEALNEQFHRGPG